MLLLGHKTLDDLIVVLLASNPRLTAAEVLARVNTGLPSAARKYSVAALYKTLRALQTHGVLVREGRVYSLHHQWIDEVEALHSTIQHRYIERCDDDVIARAGEGVCKWRFKDLQRANLFWDDLIVRIAKGTSANRIYTFSPHLWWLLTQPAQTKRLFTVISRRKIRLYKICESDAFLDRWAMSELRRLDVTVASAGSPFHRETAYLTLIGDYLIRLTLDNRSRARIEEFYDSVTTWRELTPPRLFAALSQPTEVRITLQRRGSAAASAGKKFVNYFEVT